MRSINPLWGFVALILVAVLLSAVVSKKHPNNGALPPAEQAQLDDEKKMEEMKKAQAASKAASAGKTDTPASTTPPKPVDNSSMTFEQVKESAVKVTMQVKDRGTVVMELYPKAAPATVKHFIELCRKQFYDGIKFHRLERDPAGISVLQGGDPESKNLGPEEFAAQNIGSHGSNTTTVPLEAHLSHKKYSVGLARSQAPDSGDSQFYINLEDNSKIDGQYCVFGMVVQGQDVVDKIEKGDVITSLKAE